ncbi:hypothetical protein SODALDRAFT_351549 [Sodiomyces alkalinus F11]|uniref:Uncharacterized protein n=1 Tax=Sodiomyces alkalinus (strain CBS 110278 / VKM F-3762 / F11) TaxID=1314773 RepID=A0A3N2PRY4_SODAK|nr:hypothetical protein SODALDRAFT_351549 [Sodiomyces alkalinus F11]ROT37220.1 hypothetical protein SODALDRAFT_351549 [Sodiomyces alkalinus F11]
MSSDNSNVHNNPNDMNHRRRGSVTQQALAGLFRSNSSTTGTSFQTSDPHRRRLSISTTGLGIAGTSVATSATFSGSYRRGSVSNSDSFVDENAVDEDEGSSRTAPTTPFVRRMSFGGPAMRTASAIRSGGVSPGSLNGNHPLAPPPAPHEAVQPDAKKSSSAAKNGGAGAPSSAAASAIAAALSTSGRRPSLTVQASTGSKSKSLSDRSVSRLDQGFNWSEQLRSRAESSIQGPRPSFTFGSTMSTSPPRGNSQPAAAIATPRQDRAKSFADMPAPPTQASAVSPRPAEPERRKPDPFQERILKGDFYMD